MVKNPHAGDPGSIPGSGRSPGEGIGYAHQYSWASLVAQLVKKPPTSAGDLGSIPGLGRYLGEGKDYPLQYSGLENSMDCIVHGVAESDTSERLSLSPRQTLIPAQVTGGLKTCPAQHSPIVSTNKGRRC